MAHDVARSAAAQIRTKIRWVLPDSIRQLRPRKSVAPITAADWNTSYDDGSWDHLWGDLHELARYSVLAGYIEFIGDESSILDVGCGEGILLEYLHPDAHGFYEGFDLSETAIERAKTRFDARAALSVQSVESFTSARRYDVIVLNECLYYFSEPTDVLVHLEQWLIERGTFLISMFHQPRNSQIWKSLDSRYDSAYDVTVTAHGGPSWRVKGLVRKRL